MKTYKDFPKEYIGYSDIATLILVGCNDEKGLVTMPLCFGEDHTYEAYAVDEPDAEIGEHYKKVATFNNWMKIYDDAGKTAEIHAREINVYTAGNLGCIIQFVGDCWARWYMDCEVV